MSDLRTAVVETAREMLRLGLVCGTSGNASARDGDSVLITPASMPYEQMTEDDLVAIEADGAPDEGGGVPSSEWRVHLAIYGARPDVGAVDIRRRGLAGDVDQIRRRLKLAGKARATIVITRVNDKPWGLVCTDPASPAGSA